MGKLLINTKYNPSPTEELKNSIKFTQAGLFQVITILSNNIKMTPDSSSRLRHAFVNRYVIRDQLTKFAMTYSPDGIKMANNGIVRSSPWSGVTYSMVKDLDRIYFGVGGDLSSGKSYPGSIIRLRYWDYALDEYTLRKMCLGGITQDGWFNNGDGPPPQFTYYK